jgi:hypothetical protein
MRGSLLSISAAFWALSSASAQVASCNGVYTDRPCDEVTIAATARPRPDEKNNTKDARVTAVERGKKQSALHTLRTRLFKERRRLSVELDISEAEEACASTSTSLDECRRVVERLDDKLEARVVARLETEQRDEARSPTPVTQPSTTVGQNQSTVIVVQVAPTPTNRYIIFNDPPLHVPSPHIHPPVQYPPPYYPPAPPPPVPQAGGGIMVGPRRDRTR